MDHSADYIKRRQLPKTHLKTIVTAVVSFIFMLSLPVLGLVLLLDTDLRDEMLKSEGIEYLWSFYCYYVILVPVCYYGAFVALGSLLNCISTWRSATSFKQSMRVTEGEVVKKTEETRITEGKYDDIIYQRYTIFVKFKANGRVYVLRTNVNEQYYKSLVNAQIIEVRFSRRKPWVALFEGEF